MNGADPGGLWATGSYLGDVGAVFKGYGKAIVGLFTSPWTMYEHFRANGLSWDSAKALVVGGVQAIGQGLSGDDPEAFGEAVFTLLMMASPALKKVPSPKFRKAAAVAATCEAPATPAVIYRAGGKSPSNLTVRPGEEGLSFRDSLSNPWPLPEGQQPVFRPGGEYIGVSVEKLPPGSVIFDNIPQGHVTVKPIPIGALVEAIIERGKFPK